MKTDHTKQIDDLQGKLDARRGLPGYESNVVAIEAEIARLKAGKKRRGTVARP